MAEKQILLITGANTGIGFEAVKALLSSKIAYHIILSGRDISKAKSAVASLEQQSSVSSLEALQLDITDDASIDAAFEAVKTKHGRVDILVNNAGASMDSNIVKGTMTTREAWNASYDVNVTGTQILTQTLVPLLLESSSPRLLFITSGLSSLKENSDPDPSVGVAANRTVPKGWPKPPFSQMTMAYRSSKTALNMMMLEWARLLKEDGVKVWCISPGFLATGLGGNQEMLKKMGAGDPSIGGEFIVGVVEGERDDQVGKVARADGVQAW